jgi:DNA mismatch repair ATPase MutS
MDAPVLLITGSNMAGKSTLLRTVGTAVVLAYAGTKVPARALTLGPLVVATSMRVRDSLGDGVSRFYAELAKLRTVVETGRHAPQGTTLLFLLDEVLHGTNSRERNIGARALVSALLAEDGSAAIGLLSTHDLALTDLEATTDGAVKNVHLRENVVADQMSFDYLLRRGPVTTSNALRLMKAAGLDLPGLDDSAGA